MADRAKAVVFRGGSLDDLPGFPRDARQAGGHQIDRLQQGYEPDDWKPMATVGPGVREIRIREANGAFRVICPSSDDLGHSAVFRSGGSGSSGVRG
ncbi:type II toxin-antitoxin system RelE/ParE family toxin [Methylobacterium sp. HMF5984]|uniref:type II toxin-antitoxin system RelE/ParE family toxin n=1 Tax=Methylobacterium sp. HMF5984 TaxID=3367370 RepID=UPI003851A876